MEVVFVSILQKHLLERLRLATRCFPLLAPDFCAATAVVAVKPLQSSCGLFISDQTLKHTTGITHITFNLRQQETKRSNYTPHDYNNIPHNILPKITAVVSTLQAVCSISP